MKNNMLIKSTIVTLVSLIFILTTIAAPISSSINILNNDDYAYYTYPHKYLPTEEELEQKPCSSDNYEYPPAFVEKPTFPNFVGGGAWNNDLFWNHGIRYKRDMYDKYLVGDEYNYLDMDNWEDTGNFVKKWYPVYDLEPGYTFEQGYNPLNFGTSNMQCQSFIPDCNKIGGFGLLVGRAGSSDTGFTIGLYPETWSETNEIQDGHRVWEKRPDMEKPLYTKHFTPDDIEGYPQQWGEDITTWEGKSFLGLTYPVPEYTDDIDIPGNSGPFYHYALLRNPDGFTYFTENGLSPETIDVIPGETYYIGIILDKIPDRDCNHGILIYGNGANYKEDQYSKGNMGEMDLFKWGEQGKNQYYNPVRYDEKNGKDLCFYVWGWDDAPDKPENHVPTCGQTVELDKYGADVDPDSPFSSMSPLNGKLGVWLKADIDDPDLEDRYLEVSFYGTIDPNNIYNHPNDIIKEEFFIGKSIVSNFVRKSNRPNPTTVRKFWPDLIENSGDIAYKWTVVVKDWGMQRTNIALGCNDDSPSSDYAMSLFKFYTTPYTGEAPHVEDIPDQKIAQGENFELIKLDDFVWDADTSDEYITWTWEVTKAVDPNVVDVTIDENRIANVTYEPGWQGEVYIEFKAEDPEGHNDTDVASFAVDNQPPQEHIKINKLVKGYCHTNWYKSVEVGVDELVSFKITVMNSGVESAGLILVDELPLGLEYVIDSANIEPDLIDDNNITWDLDEIGPNDIIEITFDAQTSILGKYTNWANLFVSGEQVVPLGGEPLPPKDNEYHDYATVEVVTDPEDPEPPKDTDNDGIPDIEDPDDDNDGYTDEEEISAGTDPLDPDDYPGAPEIDTDEDGIPDSDDPDDDNDGYSDIDEIAAGTNPKDPEDYPEDPDSPVDTDEDGIPDSEDPDDDNDGYTDEEEISAGTDPLDPDDHPDDGGITQSISDLISSYFKGEISFLELIQSIIMSLFKNITS